MYFGLTIEIYSDVDAKSYLITKLSDGLKKYLQANCYGSDIDKIIIGVLCIPPQGQSLYKLRQKFTKSKKCLEYDVQLKYEQFKTANESEVIQMLRIAILDSLSNIDAYRKYQFNIVQFKEDLVKYFEEYPHERE
jgi:hypothetical protein